MSKADYWKMSLTLPEDLVKFLEELSTNCKKSGGFKIARTEIIRAMIRALAELDKKGLIDISQVCNEDQLEERIVEAMKKFS